MNTQTANVYRQQTDLSESVNRLLNAIRSDHRVIVRRVIGGRMMEAELTYCRRRAEEESAAAALASDGKVRSIHLELGRRYDERASTIEAEKRRSQVHLVSTAGAG